MAEGQDMVPPQGYGDAQGAYPLDNGDGHAPVDHGGYGNYGENRDADGAGGEQKPEDNTEGKVFVGGVSWQTTEDGLRYYFGKYGEISDVLLMKDKQTGAPRGFGFVVFKNPAGKQLGRRRTVDAAAAHGLLLPFSSNKGRHNQTKAQVWKACCDAVWMIAALNVGLRSSFVCCYVVFSLLRFRSDRYSYRPGP